MAFLNAAFYRFTALEKPSAWAERLESAIRHLALKGTFILAPEGLNAFVAGEEEAVRECLRLLESFDPFQNLEVKESYSSSIPFEKLCFKVKSEIVTFRELGFSPLTAEAPRLSPEELDRWYAEGKDFVVVDTRNDYEVKIGAFRGAHTLPLKHFVNFPAAAATLPEEWKEKKLLTYCTGGIRCEKAAPYLRSLGFDAYQLDGGILNYLEQSGKNWEGECFVFDQRVALNGDLSPSGATLCPGCQGPVPAGKNCPQCEG
jgi:UPF0176 protein